MSYEKLQQLKSELATLEKELYPNVPTSQEKIDKYERVLHLIQMHAAVTMNHMHVQKLVSNICNWSYAHRCGNGEISKEHTDSLIKQEFDNLDKLK